MSQAARSQSRRDPTERTALRLTPLVLHDDTRREYAYGPAQGLPDTKAGTLTPALYHEAKEDGDERDKHVAAWERGES